MRKLFLLVFITFISGMSFGQAVSDTPILDYIMHNKELTKRFNVAFGAASGSILHRGGYSTVDGSLTSYYDEKKLWSGSEYTIDLGYSQNWTRVPWLTTTFVTSILFTPVNVYEGNNTAPAYRGGPENPALISGKVVFNMSKYFTFYVNTKLSLGVSTQWSWTKDIHGIFITLGIDVNAGNKAISGSDFKAYRDSGKRDGFPNIIGDLNGTPVKANGPVLDGIWLDFVWVVRLPLGFSTTFVFRPFSIGGDNASQMLENLYVKFGNTFAWTRDGFNVYASINYEIKNIAYPVYNNPTGGTWKNGINHHLTVSAGLVYSYNLSPL